VTEAEVSAIIARGESDRVEFKKSFSDWDIERTICALANDLPNHGQSGHVLIGVRDNGEPSGIEVTDQLLQNLANIRGQGKILPLPSLSIHKVTFKGSAVVVIVVEPSDAPPVRFEGRVWVRVGPTARPATAQDERILSERNRFRNLPRDMFPQAAASMSDHDLALFQREYLPYVVSAQVLEENDRPVELQLASLHLWHSESFCPTMLGLLVCGRDPEPFFPGAWLQFVRYEGTEATDPILDQKRLSGPLPDLMRRLDEILRLNIRTATDIVTADTEIRLPDYPIEALQQITRNAVIHRDYEVSTPIRIEWFTDRVEVTNPGGPFGVVTRENFARRPFTSYRNPNLAAAMKHLGYVQQFGVGIATAQKALAKNGNPELEFEIEINFVLARLKSR
jgi:ATP-dependent DNA helicase RecG